MTNKLKVGSQVWLPCEVKPGPFSNERLVRVELPSEPWVGFVETNVLKEPITEGATFILATIVTVDKETFSARLPGHAIKQGEFTGSLSQVTSVDSLAV
ncbi:MAG: hypothetical protein J4F42_21310 [Desulfurellaceae bacterium]|nr:hypothetical protein [Desulfurellaceae bacterium]